SSGSCGSCSSCGGRRRGRRPSSTWPSSSPSWCGPRDSSEVDLPSVSDQRTRPAPVRSHAAGGGIGGVSRLRPVLAIVVVVAVLALWPSVAPNAYMLSAGVVVLNYAVLATGWNIMGGFTGYISLGHVAFFGLGSYGTGLLVIHTGLNWLLATLVSALAAAGIRGPIGFAALRVRRSSFVIVTIALVLVLQLICQSWSVVTGGSGGLVVPRPFPDMLRPEHHETFFYIFLALLAVTLLVWTVIDRSRF